MHLNHIRSIRRRYDRIYISPHFDDVAASCGGRILKQGQNHESILVVTVFSAHAHQVPDVNNSALKARLDYDRRRLEDQKAMQRLTVDYLWLELPEFLYRNQKPWQRYWPTYPATTTNQRLCRQISTCLDDICQKAHCAEMVLPLGIGQHVDHQIVYQAGLSLKHHHPITFYEDMPYALFPFLLLYRLKKTGIWQTMSPQTRRQISVNRHISSKTLARLLVSLQSLGLHRKCLQSGLALLLECLDIVVQKIVQPRNIDFGNRRPIAAVLDISDPVDQKLEAISAYTSQLTSPLFTPQNIKKGLAAYALTLGLPEGCHGERYWRMI